MYVCACVSTHLWVWSAAGSCLCMLVVMMWAGSLQEEMESAHGGSPAREGEEEEEEEGPSANSAPSYCVSVNLDFSYQSTEVNVEQGQRSD